MSSFFIFISPFIVSAWAAVLWLPVCLVDCGSPIRSSGSSIRHPNDLDVTSYLPALTTEYADILDESKYKTMHYSTILKSVEKSPKMSHSCA